MPDADAALLLTRVAGRPGLDPASAEVTSLLDLFFGMPIIITALGGQLKKYRTLRPSDLRARLGRRGGPLRVWVSERDTVRDVLELSYRNLSPGLQLLFRYLALHPGPDFDSYAAAALVGATEGGSVLAGMDDLFGFHLIDEVAPERYRFHGLIREYARELVSADPRPDRETAERRLLGYYLHMARVADGLLGAGIPTGVTDEYAAAPMECPELASRVDAFAWLEDHAGHLHAAAGYALGYGYREYATLIPAFMAEYLVRHGHWNQGIDLHKLALEAAGDEDLPGRARALYHLGYLLYLKGNLDGGETRMRTALELYEQVGDRVGQARALRRLGSIQVIRGDYAGGGRVWQRALDIFSELDDKRAGADMLGRLGVVLHENGDMDAAFEAHSAARDACALLDDPIGQANALCYLGEIYMEQGQFDESLRNLRQGIEIYDSLGDDWNVAGARYFLGVALRAAGRLAEARAELDAALVVYRKMDDKFDEAGVLNQIGLLLAASGDFDSAELTLEMAMRLYDERSSESGRLEVLSSQGELTLARARSLAAVPAAALATGRVAALVQALATAAFELFRQAHDIATEKKVPREQARASEGIGHALRLAGRTSDAAAWLSEAHALYEKLGFPAAARLIDEGLVPPPAELDGHAVRLAGSPARRRGRRQCLDTSLPDTPDGQAQITRFSAA
jgi:tetratricopeptide (TPR) repeat protein